MRVDPHFEALLDPDFDVEALEQEIAESLAFVGGVTAREGHSIVLACPTLSDDEDLDARLSFRWLGPGDQQGQTLSVSFQGRLPIHLVAQWDAAVTRLRFAPSLGDRLKQTLWGSLRTEADVYEPIGIPDVDALNPRGSRAGRLEAATHRAAIERFDDALIRLSFSSFSISGMTKQLPRATALQLGEAFHGLWAGAIHHRRLTPKTAPLTTLSIPAAVHDGLRDVLPEGFSEIEPEAPGGASFAAAGGGLRVLVVGNSDGRTVDVDALGVVPSRPASFFLERPAKWMWRLLPPVRLGAHGIDRRFRIDGDDAGLEEARTLATSLEPMADCFHLHLLGDGWGAAAKKLDLAQCLRFLRGAAQLHDAFNRHRGSSSVDETPVGDLAPH